MNSIRLVVGLIIAASGLLWMGQGAGYINWPQSSFMLQQTQWIWYGGATLIAGLALVFLALKGRR